MTEGEVFGIVHEAVMKAGGEMGMIQIDSCSMLDPDINDLRPRPVEKSDRQARHHQQRAGDFLQWLRSSVRQAGGDRRADCGIQEMFEIAIEGYRRLVPTLYAGKSSEDSIQAMHFIRDTRYEFYGGFLAGDARRQSAPRAANRFRPGAECRGSLIYSPRTADSVYQVGHVFTLQMNIVDRKHTRRSVFVIRDKTAACLSARSETRRTAFLNKFPLEDDCAQAQ